VARALAGAVALAALALAAVALVRYSGSALVFVFFNLCFAAFVGLALPKPRLYGYTVFALLLLLGLWGKTMVHTIWPLEFLEPVGAFDYSPEKWDAALLAMSIAALGMATARLAHLWLRRRRPVNGSAAHPGWFDAHRRAIWVTTLIAIAAVNLANLEFAFYQIGVNPKLLLPGRLHVAFAWAVNVGFALWVATLVGWEYQSGRRGSVALGFVEATVSSISAFSRILFLVHAGAYCLALWERRRDFTLSRTLVVLLGASFMVLMVVSVLAVFWLRAVHYPNNADVRHNIKSEVPQLVLQRWVGLEGTLTAVSAPARSIELLRQAVTDRPRSGSVDSVYQRVAGARFKEDTSGRFAFGSNAGPLAILAFSGSLLVVFAGMAGIVLVLAVTEDVAERWTGNPFLLALSGTALANVLTQSTFAYLTLIFLLQLWLMIGVVGALVRVGR